MTKIFIIDSSSNNKINGILLEASEAQHIMRLIKFNQLGERVQLSKASLGHGVNKIFNKGP